MLEKRKPNEALFQMVSLDELVPDDHFLRKVDAAVDFSFIRDMVRPLYCERNGRPPVDPELALRMFALRYLYNLSENRLCEEVSLNIAYRWFCGLNLHDPVPHRTTLVKLRRERWGPAGVYDAAIHRVLRQCVDAGLVSDDIAPADGTVMKARTFEPRLEPMQEPLPFIQHALPLKVRE